MPSITNWIANATRIIPNNRLSTILPVTPSAFEITSANRNTTQHIRQTAVIMPMRSPKSAGSPLVCPASSMVAVMAPGPAMRGIASGNAATLRIWSRSMADLATLLLRAVRRSNTISKAIQNSSNPPAIRKAGSVIPSNDRIFCPATAKNASASVAINVARQATCRLSAAVIPTVKARNMGAIAGGSTVTSKVTKAFDRNSIRQSCLAALNLARRR